MKVYAFIFTHSFFYTHKSSLDLQEYILKLQTGIFLMEDTTEKVLNTTLSQFLLVLDELGEFEANQPGFHWSKRSGSVRAGSTESC